MVKAFRPSLEPPADRQVKVNDSARPLLCVFICVGVASLVLSAFAASGWNFYINRFDKDRLHFSTGDEVAVSDVTNDFSSFFCDSYEVKLWERGQVFLLPSTTKVNTSLNGPEETISMLQVPGLAYRELSLYLLDQSEVSLSACRQNGSQRLPAEIFLIKGKSNLRSWREDKTCSSCVEKRMHIPYDIPCTVEEEEVEEIYYKAELEKLGVDALQNSKSRSNLNAESTDKSDVPLQPQGKISVFSEIPHIFSENSSVSHDVPKTLITPERAMFNYTVPSNDRYYIVIFYGTPKGPESVFIEPGIKLLGTVKRTQFNVKDAQKVCTVNAQSPEMVSHEGNSNSSSSNICRFNLPWNSNKDIVVHFGGLRLEKSREISHNLVDNLRGHMDPEIDTGTEDLLIHALDHEGMLTKCHIRLSVWICLFGVLPAIVVIIISSVIGVLLCRRRPKQFRARYRKKHRHSSRKKHRAKDILVDEEVLPEGAQSSMAIQGD